MRVLCPELRGQSALVALAAGCWASTAGRQAPGGPDVSFQAPEQGRLVALIFCPEELIQVPGSISLRKSSECGQRTRGSPPFLEKDRRHGPCSGTSYLPSTIFEGYRFLSQMFYSFNKTFYCVLNIAFLIALNLNLV